MAHYRPDAATLLAAVAEVLDDVLHEVGPDQRHRVRVAAHLARLVERETALGAAAAAGEAQALAALIGADLGDAAIRDDPTALGEALAARLRDELDGEHGEEFEAAAWSVLVEITRRDLEVDKPGYTDWTGR